MGNQPTSGTGPIKVHSTTPDQARSPDLQQVNSVVLYEGPRSRREIVHYAIRDRNTGEPWGNNVVFRTRHLRQRQWENEPSKCFTLEADQEIATAIRFMLAAAGGGIPAEAEGYVMLPISGADAAGLQRVLDGLLTGGHADVLAELLGQAAQAPDLLNALMRQAARNPELFVEAAATLNLARYKRALSDLDHVIGTSVREQDFQRLLTENPWMFGSEYSEHLRDRRMLVRGSQQDFVLRRTADGYIEVVEIKTPLDGQGLFRYDQSHQSHYPRKELAEALGQVQKYVEELDDDRLRIKAVDGEDASKVRAKIIIGRDGDEAQRQALRRFNGHLHRIELLTFDQLSRTAKRVVSYLEGLVPARGNEPAGADTDVP